jgi:hypothetical protein
MGKAKLNKFVFMPGLGRIACLMRWSKEDAMKTPGIALALAAVVVSYGTTSRADDTDQPSTTTLTPTPAPAPSLPQPQPAPPLSPIEPPPLVGTTTTTAMPYSPTGQPFESTTNHYPNGRLLAGGAGLFFISYIPAVFAASVSDRDEDKKLYIPIVGPWIDLAERDCTTRPCGSQETVNKALIATSGFVQNVGLVLGVLAFIIPEKVATTSTTSETKPSVHVTPISYGTGAGVGAIGRF